MKQTPLFRLLFQMGKITPITEVWTKKEYQAHTIELVQHPYTGEWEYMYYPTAEGIQHDGDSDCDGFKYCGNCRWSSDLDDVMDSIDEKFKTK